MCICWYSIWYLLETILSTSMLCAFKATVVARKLASAFGATLTLFNFLNIIYEFFCTHCVILIKQHYLRSISISKFKYVNSIVTSINTAIPTYYWNIKGHVVLNPWMLTSMYCYCMHKASTKILHFFLYLCDMLQIDYTTTCDQYYTSQFHRNTWSRVSKISHYTISHYNLKYIIHIYNIDINIDTKHKDHCHIKKYLLPKSNITHHYNYV